MNGVWGGLQHTKQVHHGNVVGLMMSTKGWNLHGGCMDCGGHFQEAHEAGGPVGDDLERDSSMYALVILN